jgi:hypothetical protein
MARTPSSCVGAAALVQPQFPICGRPSSRARQRFARSGTTNRTEEGVSLASGMRPPTLPIPHQASGLTAWRRNDDTSTPHSTDRLPCDEGTRAHAFRPHRRVPAHARAPCPNRPWHPHHSACNARLKPAVGCGSVVDALKDRRSNFPTVMAVHADDHSRAGGRLTPAIPADGSQRLAEAASCSARARASGALYQRQPR